jgi:predicted GNAT family acetyltransferase
MIGAVRYVLTDDPEEFSARTAAFFAAHIECNVLATVLLRVLDGGHRDPPPLFAYGLASGGEVAFAALRTPPWPLLASPLIDGTAQELVAQWLAVDPEVSSVTAVPAAARALAQAWARHTGGAFHTRMREAMHVLEEVRDPPRPAPGALRVAAPADRDLLLAWMEEFVREAGVAGPAQAATWVDGSIGRGGLLFWEDGEPVSMLGVNPKVAGVVRVGPVYTPPPLRGRGYAGTAVAAASRRALASGARRCMLFTDVTNPTSNKIYGEVGYRRVGDWEEIELTRAKIELIDRNRV